MYELIILTLLMRWPMHGYLIMKVTNDQIGPWAKISSGTLSTILGKLEQEGLISVMTEAQDPSRKDRRSRTFMITEEGRMRFRQLMMDTSSHLGDYQKIFYYKLGYFDLLRQDERLLLLNHYVNYCHTTVLYMQTEMDGLKHELASYQNPTYLENLLRVMKHIEEQWQADLDWVKDIRAQELAQTDTGPSASSGQSDLELS